MTEPKAEAQSDLTKFPYTAHENGITLQVHALPGAKKSAVAGLSEGRLRIKLAARALEGRANKELLELIASCLGVSKSSVSLSRGEKSREKSVFIEGDAKLLSARLNRLIFEES